MVWGSNLGQGWTFVSKTSTSGGLVRDKSPLNLASLISPKNLARFLPIFWGLARSPCMSNKCLQSQKSAQILHVYKQYCCLKFLSLLMKVILFFPSATQNIFLCRPKGKTRLKLCSCNSLSHFLVTFTSLLKYLQLFSHYIPTSICPRAQRIANLRPICSETANNI